MTSTTTTVPADDARGTAPPVTLRRVHLGAGGPLSDVRTEGGLVTAVHPAGTAPQAEGEDLDLDGRTLLPGLWDAHVHMVQWAGVRRRLDLSGAGSARDAADAAGRRAEGLPADEPLIGYGFRDALWPDTPHKDLLDALVPDRPTLLISMDLHCAWLNSAALATVGRGGHPTGLLFEGESMRAIAELTAVPARVTDQWVREAAAAAAARGVTGIVDFEYADNITDWTRRMSEESTGTFPLRVAASIWLPQLEGAIARGLRTGRLLPVPGGLLEVGPFKLLTDGSLNTRTALCHDPYPDRDPEAPDARGLEEVSPGELVSLLRRASGHGITPAVHAIGDRANEMALDAFETVRCRGSVEHGQLLAAKDVPRFAELGVTVSVQPTHAVDDRDVARRHWAGRTHRAYAFADLLAAGADLALGSDAPVAPLDPWLTIASAVERTDDERPPFHPEQRIPVTAALAASSRGRRLIRAGDDADLVITDTDPLTADTATLRAMPVHATMLAGVWTHRTS
ncbi:amidohydrolase [Streptomyces sp. NPDC057245]|uniref:amidohydrolase n=1 Tax=Streptomyces TaxID=1883 RepID=UPI001C1DD1F0|nr:amidohydrolase family protein [Streptomyces sp. A108]MBU6531866.1 amidohydrolase family protein [Streptomyces sp. A108]